VRPDGPHADRGRQTFPKLQKLVSKSESGERRVGVVEAPPFARLCGRKLEEFVGR
jgi:hypothetical protein